MAISLDILHPSTGVSGQLLCALLGFSAIALGLIAKTLRRSPSGNLKGLPLPPGPKPLPIVGNVLDVPTSMMAERFRDLTDKYGEIVHLDAVGHPMIILGSHEVATELLDRRSANYSSRVESPMRILSGWEWTFVLMPYGPDWRRRRKEFHQFFHPTAVAQYQPLQQREAVKFLKNLLDKPETLFQQVRNTFASTITKISYGRDSDENDKHAAAVEEGVGTFNLAFVPGAFLVELFPSLQYLPRWLPGAGFKRLAASWKTLVHNMRNQPFEQTMEEMKEGKYEPSVATLMMEKLATKSGADLEAERRLARDTSAVVYAAGGDTTISTVQTFFLAMVCYPEVQRRARMELDAVVGPNRMPTFEDRDSLPYITAIAKEAMRWQLVAPIGLSHVSLKDDEYNGYFIPAGSAVIANLWAFTHDPSVYPDPDTFNPDRFLKDGKINPDVRDPNTIVFGYGRRICPGRHFAEASLFILIASVLHTLNIDYAVDKRGQPIIPEPKMTYGVISYPVEFPCSIKARSPAYEALIHTGLVQAAN